MKVNKQNCLAVKCPEVAKEWHLTKNGNLTTNDVVGKTHKKAWWKCSNCNHEWEAVIGSRANGCGCPACAGKVATKSNCLATKNPELAKEWHPTKNGNLTPNDVVGKTHKKAWWKCSNCDHEWEAAVSNRANGCGCPACAGKVATKSNCLATKNPEVAKEWHLTKNENLTPNDVVCGNNDKAWWKCAVCNHEWEAVISSRSNGCGCPACSNRVVTKSNCLATKNPELAKEWHPTKNENLTPNDVAYGGDKKYWWQCTVCNHEWEAKMSHRVNGSGCPACAGFHPEMSINELCEKLRHIIRQKDKASVKWIQLNGYDWILVRGMAKLNVFRNEIVELFLSKCPQFTDEELDI